MLAWWDEIRRSRKEASDASEAAELCLSATVWAWRKAEDRPVWAAAMIELAKGAGAPRRRIVWGEDIPMPSLEW
jgi:hypothetical protein